jgi:hypothetical protein
LNGKNNVIEVHAAEAGGALGERVKKYSFGIKGSVALPLRSSNTTTGVFRSKRGTISAVDAK